LVQAVIPRGTHAGKHGWHVTIWARKSFRLHGIDVHPRQLTVLEKADGYECHLGVALPPHG